MQETICRGRGRPRGFNPAPKSYKDRFQKFYFEHRDRLNEERRELYQMRKATCRCVRCKAKALKGSVFCAEHREASRAQNRKGASA